MKNLDVTTITPSASMPMKRGILEFLQSANKEIFAAMMIAQIGDNYDPDQIYILYGCNNAVAGFPSSSEFTINVSAGAVFYNGEVYNVSNTVVMVNSGVSSDFYFTPQTDPTKIFLNKNEFSDPVTFKDGTARYILQTNTMTISEQLISGYSDNKTRLRYAPHLSWNTVSTAIYMVDGADTVVNLPKITPGDSVFVQMATMSSLSQTLSIWLNNVKIIKVIDSSTPLFGTDLLITLITDSLSDNYYWRIEPVSTSIPIIEVETILYRINTSSCLTITSTGLGTFTTAG
jgi:hypothetical protein